SAAFMSSVRRSFRFMGSQLLRHLAVLAPASRFALLLAPHAGLLVVLTLTNLGEPSRPLQLALETAKGAIQRLVLADFDLGHPHFPPLRWTWGKKNTLRDYTAAQSLCQLL